MKKYISPTANRVRMNIESAFLAHSLIEADLSGNERAHYYDTRRQEAWMDEWTDADE